MFALFEDDFTIIHGAAGFAAFGSSTSGYGYSPPSATLAGDDDRLKMCLLYTCERLTIHKKSNLFKSIIRSLKMVAFFTFLYKQVLGKKLMTAYLRVVFFFVADVFFVLEVFFVVEAFFVVVFFVEEVLLVDEAFVAGL